MSYTHISWFDADFLKGKTIIEMCKCCGNTDKSIIDCPNCDIGFEKYVYLEDKK